MTRERHARFCERRRVKSPPPTHHQVMIHQRGWTLIVNPDGTTTARTASMATLITTAKANHFSCYPARVP